MIPDAVEVFVKASKEYEQNWSVVNFMELFT